MLVRCSECGKKISDQAEQCPHCGCPQSTPSSISPTPTPREGFRNSRWLIISIPLFLIALLLVIFPLATIKDIQSSARAEWYLEVLKDEEKGQEFIEYSLQIQENHPELSQDEATQLVLKEIDQKLLPRVILAQVPFFLSSLPFFAGGIFCFRKYRVSRLPAESIS